MPKKTTKAKKTVTTPKAEVTSVAEHGSATPITDVTAETAKAMIASKRLVLLDCSASWCGPCKMLRDRLEKEVVPMMPKDMVIISINVDKIDYYADELGNKSMQTFSLFL